MLAFEAYERDDMTEFLRLSKIIPIESKKALYLKDTYGSQCLIALGLNLAVANEELEQGWLTSGEDDTKNVQNEENDDDQEELNQPFGFSRPRGTFPFWKTHEILKLAFTIDENMECKSPDMATKHGKAR